MTGREKALDYFARHYNCAQSALVGCGHLTGLDDDTALRVAGAFGGGMRIGSVCGAATGGLMALGAIFPFVDSDRPEDKARIGQKTTEFLEAFAKAHGCLDCDGLVKGDKEGAHETLCPRLVAWVADKVAEMAAPQAEPAPLAEPAPRP